MAVIKAVDKIINWAKSQVGSSAYNGYCQRFIRLAYEKGYIYDKSGTATATQAYKKWCVSTSKNNIPVGAAVYFDGTDPAVGHVGLYIGQGKVINPESTVRIRLISDIPNYRGWGWQGGVKPSGATDPTESTKKTPSSSSGSAGGAGSTKKKKDKEITSTVIKSVTGYDPKKRDYVTTKNVFNTYYELYIHNGRGIYKPIVYDGITLELERLGTAGKLTFTVIKDNNIAFDEGNTVIFKVGGVGLFYGYVFTKKRNKDHHIEVTAYDQLRYFANSDTYIYKNKRADEVLKMIADDYKLNVGTLPNTKYTIPLRNEDNQTLFDIMYNALDITNKNTGKLFLLYDNFGYLQLSNTNDLKLDLLINSATAEDFDYETSIDSETYTQVQVYKDNGDTGVREKYIAKDGKKISEYGVLQLVEKCEEKENPTQKAKNLLAKYNNKTRKLTVRGCFGDVRVRAGSQVMVRLNLGDIIQNAYMMVDKVTHTFENDKHSMDLTLIRYGQFIS